MISKYTVTMVTLMLLMLLHQQHVVFCLTNITLAGLFSTGGPDAAWDGSGILHAAQMALEHVNRNETLLPEYHLQLDWRNSKVSIQNQNKAFSWRNG